MKWGLKGCVSINADSGPLRYVLWCCSSICHQLFTFIQIYSGHTVISDIKSNLLQQICSRYLHTKSRTSEDIDGPLHKITKGDIFLNMSLKSSLGQGTHARGTQIGPWVVWNIKHLDLSYKRSSIAFSSLKLCFCCTQIWTFFW